MEDHKSHGRPSYPNLRLHTANTQYCGRGLGSLAGGDDGGGLPHASGLGGHQFHDGGALRNARLGLQTRTGPELTVSQTKISQIGMRENREQYEISTRG